MTKKRIKVIVNKNISSKIQKGQIITVSHGFARNYLIPQQIASLISYSALHKSHSNQQISNQKDQENFKYINTIKDLLNYTNKISIQRKVSGHYRFFGSISSTTIMQKLLDITGIIIEKKQIELITMRKIGLYTVKIQLSSNLTINLNIQVMPI